MQKSVRFSCLIILTLVAFGCGGGGGGVIPEMKAFMGEFDGTYQAVESALEKYAPYTMEAKAGITIRTYVLCWKDGKILSIADKGMR